tara:strand:- start:159 stop:782 length:624 start_codon:yes stop_codon:yes gene_type:complete
VGLSVASINKQIETAPLSRKEAKEQFINKTKEFNLQHAFNFDEAWAFVEYKTKQKDFRKTIASFEETLKNHENSLGTETHTLNPTKHSFADGQYIREIYNPAGLVLITKIHAKTHPFFLMQGEMTIVTEKGVERIAAPYQGITEAGTKRVILTHTECVFITVHRTDKLTVEEIEQDVIATSFDKEHLTVPDTKHIRRLIKEMNKCLG